MKHFSGFIHCVGHPPQWRKFIILKVNLNWCGSGTMTTPRKYYQKGTDWSNLPGVTLVPCGSTCFWAVDEVGFSVATNEQGPFIFALGWANLVGLCWLCEAIYKCRKRLAWIGLLVPHQIMVSLLMWARKHFFWSLVAQLEVLELV